MEEPRLEDFENEGDYLAALEEWKFFLKHGYVR